MSSSPSPSVLTLPPETVSQIVSGQIINGPSAAVKELLENALDAGAKQIQVHLEDYGLGYISVSDNGSGVSSSDLGFMTQAHCTSKIRDFADLDALTSFGFRGEALNAITKLAKVEIRSKSRLSSESHGWSVHFDPRARELSRKPFVMNPGTTVIAREFFHQLPVRRKLYQSGGKSKKKAELKRIENLCRALALTHPQVRIELFHDRKSLFQKPAQPNEQSAINQVFGLQLAKHLSRLEFQGSDFRWVMYLPRGDCDPAIASRASADQTFLTINRRWVEHRPILKLIRRLFQQSVQVDKYPVGLISLIVGPGQIDVNLDPNKYSVLLKEEQTVLDSMEDKLKRHFQRDAPPRSPEVGSSCSSLDSSINRSIFDQIEARPFNLLEPLAPEVQESDDRSQDFDLDADDVNPMAKTKKPNGQILNAKPPVNLKENQRPQKSDSVQEKEEQTIGGFSQSKFSQDSLGSLKSPILLKSANLNGSLRQKTLDSWSHGHSVVDGNGDFVAPVRLHTKNQSNPSKPVDPKRASSNVRPASSTSRPSNSVVGNDTLGQMVAPFGTPIINRKTHVKIHRKTTTVSFSMTLAKEHLSVKESSSAVSAQDPQLIGQLAHSGFWIVYVCLENDGSDYLGLLNHFRAEEVQMYHKLMANYHVKPNVLLNETLEVVDCLPNIVEDDPRFVANGLGLKICGQRQKVWLISTSSVVDSLGLPDVKEIILKIQECPEISLQHCRPSTVKDFFRAESIRLTQQNPPIKTRAEVKDLLRFIQEFKTRTCLHHRPIIERVFDLGERAT